MYKQVEKPKENTSSADKRKSMAVANSVTQKKSNEKHAIGFVDNRAETIALQNLQRVMNGDNNKQHKGSILQLARSKEDADKDMKKVMGYSSIGLTYTQEEVSQVLEKTGVGGHLSGGQGDGMNARTQRDLGVVVDGLRKNRATKKKKKKAVIREERPKTNFEKALIQAQTTYQGDLAEFINYLERKGWEFTEEENSQLFSAV